MSRSRAWPGLRTADVARLRCPETHEPLVFVGRSRNDRLWDGELISGWTSRRWPVRRGHVRLFREDRVGAPDRFMRRIYDNAAVLHDPAVKIAMPLFQLQGSERAARDFVIDRLELGALRKRPDGEPVRILEVSLGTGANVPHLLRKLPGDVPVEWWGLDLSQAMLARGADRMRRLGLDPHLLLADAHRLPFADHQFDRVFHVGGINGFSDPGLALAELARVAKPGTPVVVSDEQLQAGITDPYRRAMFALVTFYDDDPRSPVDLVPPGAVDVRDEQASPFFYCLSFRMPGRVAGPP